MAAAHCHAGGAAARFHRADAGCFGIDHTSGSRSHANAFRSAEERGQKDAPFPARVASLCTNAAGERRQASCRLTRRLDTPASPAAVELFYLPDAACGRGQKPFPNFAAFVLLPDSLDSLLKKARFHRAFVGQ